MQVIRQHFPDLLDENITRKSFCNFLPVSLEIPLRRRTVVILV